LDITSHRFVDPENKTNSLWRNPNKETDLTDVLAASVTTKFKLRGLFDE
jgi:hypothetical protein